MSGASPAGENFFRSNFRSSTGENAARFPAHGKSDLAGLRAHKKTDRGRARDRRTVLEFQFHE
jgi:hypothetical protein